VRWKQCDFCCLTFSRDQYISLHYLNANLRDAFFEKQIEGTFGPTFHVSERAVYKEFQSTNSTDKEQKRIGENLFLRKKGLTMRTSHIVNKLSQSAIKRVIF